MPQIKAVDNKKNNNKKFIIFLNENFNLALVVIVIIVLFAAYVLVIKPKFNATLISIKDNINQQEQFYYSQKQRLVDLKASADLYGDLDEEDIARVQAILPAEYPKEKLFGDLEDIISQQGILINSINLVKEGEDAGGESQNAANDQSILNFAGSDKIGIIHIELSLGAIDYAALKNLLPLLESHVQLLDIESISFDADEKTATLALFTYYFK